MTERAYAKMHEPADETVSVDSATARYAGQWILMLVTKFNERQDPVAGQIVGTWSPGKQSERAISRKFGGLAQSPETPTEPYYLFEARSPGDGRESQQATGDLIARVVAVIGEHRTVGAQNPRGAPRQSQHPETGRLHAGRSRCYNRPEAPKADARATGATRSMDILELVGDLSSEDFQVLESLNEAGASGATELAVRLRQIPTVVIPHLATLKQTGLVEARAVRGKYDAEVYRVSDVGRRVLFLRGRA